MSVKFKTINSLYFLLLFVMCIYYGVERTMLFDGADRLYEMIAFKNIYFNHYRFSTGINGIIPWIFRLFTVDAKFIMWGFILNYAFTPLFVFIILRYYFKNEYLVTFYLVSTSLFYTTLFFHPNHDILLGFHYIFLLYGFLFTKHYSETKYYLLIVFLLCICVSFTHPTQLPAAFLLLLYLKYIQKNDYPLIKVLLLFFLSIFIKMQFFSNSYEKGIFLRALDFKERFIGMFSSLLVDEFFRSLITINIVSTFVMLLLFYSLLNNRKYFLLGLIFMQLVITLLYISFFYGFYPYSFCTEGYIKGASILIAVAFLDYFLYKEKNINFTAFILAIIYAFTLLITNLNGVNYKIYYNNLSKMTKKITKNTIYVSADAKDIDHYFILHRHSALINMVENDRCNYFQYIKDSTNWINDIYIKDIADGKFCFKENPIYLQPDSTTKQILDKQYDLLFNLVKFKSFRKLKEYTYISSE